MTLEDYKEIVATCAMITTMGQMLSGTLVCKDIYNKGTADGFDPVPFVGGSGLALLMLQYALILGDPAMINVNLFGLLTNVAYIFVFFTFATEKSKIVSLMAKTGALVALFLGYAHWEDPQQVQFRFGLIITILLILLIASPMANLGTIIRTKSTELLPFPLILMGTFVSFQWLLYGFIIDNSFIIFQNVVGFTLNVAQLSLFVIFPSKPVAEPSVDKKDK